MSFIIKANNEPVAEITDLYLDESMGVQRGKFSPLVGYKRIEGLIKDYSRIAFELNFSEAANNKKFQNIIKEIEVLKIVIIDESGETLKCSKVDLRDYSNDLGGEGYELTIYLE